LGGEFLYLTNHVSYQVTQRSLCSLLSGLPMFDQSEAVTTQCE